MPHRAWHLPERPHSLTPREREIMGMVAEGSDNAEIAAHMGILRKSVENYLNHIYCKLGIDGGQGNRRIRAMLIWQAGEGQDNPCETWHLVGFIKAARKLQQARDYLAQCEAEYQQALSKLREQGLGDVAAMLDRRAVQVLGREEGPC